MPVASANPEYINNVEVWEMIRDCVLGQHAVKCKSEKYLPNPDELTRDVKRYKKYIQRALFEGVTAKTLYGVVGNVFRKPIYSELPPEIDYIVANADGKGNGVENLSRRVYKDVISIGRVGLLVDFPYSDGPLTVAQIKTQNYKAKILYYAAENIINWCTRVINSVEMLDLVVLKECEYVCDDDIFNRIKKIVYRVLLLDDNGIYRQQIWECGDDNDYSIRVDIIPVDVTGQPFNFIPFTFVGSYDNTPEINKAPMEDLASVDIALYRNSADFEEMLYISGQPTFVFSGLTQNWIDSVMQSTIQVGSRKPVYLPENSNASLLQIQPSNIIREAMQDKRKAMVALGARIILDKNQPEAAEAIRLKQTGEGSIMTTAVLNTENAISKCLEWCTLFMGGTPELIKFDINKDFINLALTPDEIRALVMLWQSNVISLPLLRSRLREGEIINDDVTDDEIDEQLQSFGRDSINEATIQELLDNGYRPTSST